MAQILSEFLILFIWFSLPTSSLWDSHFPFVLEISYQVINSLALRLPLGVYQLIGLLIWLLRFSQYSGMERFQFVCVKVLVRVIRKVKFTHLLCGAGMVPGNWICAVTVGLRGMKERGMRNNWQVYANSGPHPTHTLQHSGNTFHTWLVQECMS